MHCFNLTAPYAVLTKLVALRLECVHYRLNWAEKGVCRFIFVQRWDTSENATKILWNDLGGGGIINQYFTRFPISAEQEQNQRRAGQRQAG